jgi:hypothetical protein
MSVPDLDKLELGPILLDIQKSLNELVIRLNNVQADLNNIKRENTSHWDNTRNKFIDNSISTNELNREIQDLRKLLIRRT